MEKTFTLLFFIFLSLQLQSQSKIQLLSELVNPKSQEEFESNLFQGINKLKFQFESPEIAVGKNYKIIIREFKNGKLGSEKTVINTKEENLPKIDKEFKFTVVAQQLLNNEKIGFFFNNFMNKQIYNVDTIFPDGTFDLRDVTGNTSKIDFEFGKEIQIALITPPNENPKAGNLGYCEVSKGNINVESWFKKYRIPQFFLIYLVVE